MSQPPRYYGDNDLHFLTTSTYRRTPVFNSERFRRELIASLAELRAELGFRLLGYVLMPEHFHLLAWPSRAANPSQIMQRLKGRTARSILKTLRQERRHAWCARMLARFSLPATVHNEANCRVWQRGPGRWSLGCPFPYNSMGLCGLMPNYWTGQIGASVNFNLPWWGLTGTYYVGLAFDLRGNLAAYYGAGGGHGVGASASAGVQVGDSNAYTVCGLRGPFAQVSSTAGANAGGTIDVFEGKGNGPGGVVRGGTVTLGPTEGASASIQGTATGVVPFRGHCGQGGLQ